MIIFNHLDGNEKEPNRMGRHEILWYYGLYPYLKIAIRILFGSCLNSLPPSTGIILHTTRMRLINADL